MESPSPVAAPFPPSPPSPADNTTLAAPPSPASLVMPPPPSPAGKEGNGNFLPTSPPPPGSSKNPALVALGVGVGIGGALVLVCVCLFAIWYKRRKRRLMLATSSSLPTQASKENLSGTPLHHWKQSTPPADSTIRMLPKLSPPPGIMSNPQSYSMGVSTSHPPTSMNSSLGFGVTVQQSSPGNGFNFSKTIFTYEELAMATDNFSSNYLLGQGGFGYVHKGVLRNGKLVAIKQLKFGSGQGEREFQAEVEIIGRVHHRHLVLLEGYCISGAQRLLVYEYVPNNSLEFHLNGKQESPLNWATRMKIAIGSAKGLVYLHEDCQPRIIHRDIKAANILLDNNFEAKVADFGLARLHSDADTHVSTRVMGTFGYLAPEYALSGKLTDKSDVFSFGVVLLELITGRRPIDKVYLDDNIVDWARPLLTQALNDGNFSTLVDPRLQAYDFAEMTRMVACAAACVRHLARRRPQMSQVVRALEGNLPLENLNDGIRPGDSMIYGSHGSSDYDSAQYKEDLKKFRKMALESQNLNSSGCSGPTSEFGAHPSGSSSEGPRSTREIELSQGDKNTTEEDDDAEQIKDISIS